MSNYFEFVLAKEPGEDNLKLFRAPRWESLTLGDEVIAETPEGEKMFIVVASATINKDDENIIDLIMKATRTAEDGVGKIVSKVVYKKLNYREEEEE